MIFELSFNEYMAILQMLESNRGHHINDIRLETIRQSLIDQTDAPHRMHIINDPMGGRHDHNGFPIRNRNRSYDGLLSRNPPMRVPIRQTEWGDVRWGEDLEDLEEMEAPPKKRRIK